MIIPEYTLKLPLEKKIYTKKISQLTYTIFKFVFILIMLFSMSAQARIKAQLITLSFKNKSLYYVLREMQKQTDYNFIYNSTIINSDIKINIDVKNATIKEALNKCLYNKNISYEIVKKTIIIKVKDNAQNVLSNASITTKKIEQNPIRGQVKDTLGNPVIGAIIRVVGVNRGTNTNENGEFSISANSGDQLQISSVGFNDTIISITQNTNFITVILTQKVNVIEQFVVTALGIKKSTKSLSYNVQDIKGDEVTKVTDANVINSLQGKIAGVTINSSATGVGGGVRVVMRGSKSLSQNNNALYVLDGVPMPTLQSAEITGVYGGRGSSGDGISNLNPEDVESMTVLTGPAAAALYGSAAANGAIQITSKRGSKKGFSLSVYNHSSFFTPFVLPRLQTQYGPSDAGAFDGWSNELTAESPKYNMKKDLFQTGNNFTEGFNLSAGNETNQTYFSAAILNGRGVLESNNLKRYNFNFRNTSSYFKDKLQLDLNATFVKVDELNMLSQGQYSNPLFSGYLLPANTDINAIKLYERYDIIRNFNIQFWPYGQQGYTMENPFWIMNREQFPNTKNRYIFATSVKYAPTTWFNVTGRVKYDIVDNTNEIKYYATSAPVFANKNGFYSQLETHNKQLYADLIGNYNKSFSDFTVNVNLGTSILDNKNSNLNIGGNLVTVPNLFTFNNINSVTTLNQVLPTHIQTQSVFFNSTIGYKYLLYLDVTARNDWSSTLAYTDAKNKGFFYPSVGLSAIVTDIAKIRSDVLSFLKIRGSLSWVGNPLPPNLDTSVYPIVNGNLTTVTYGYPNLKPERTKSLEAGIEARFWHNKIGLNVTLYKSNTYNQLFNFPVSASTGKNALYVNAGNVQNKGIEATLSYNGNIDKVLWNTNFLFGLNRNKIVKMLSSFEYPANSGSYYSADSVVVSGTGNYLNIIKTNGQMGDVYVNTLRKDNQGNIYVDPTTGAVSPNPINSPSSFVYAGNSSPRYNLGWRNEFSYKGFNLSFVVTGRIGGIVVSQTQAILDNYGMSQKSADDRNNGGVRLLNGYVYPNVQSYYQSINSNGGVLSQYVYSATNCRLSEASIGYTLDSKIFHNKIKQLTFSITGRNLWMLYNKAPFDPETTASTGTYYQGIDYFIQPSLRNLGFSVRVNL